MDRDFITIPHTADLKIRVFGTTLAELFSNALIGMFQSIEPKTSMCSTQSGRLVCTTLNAEHEVMVSSSDKEALLVDFLSQALYLSDVHNEAYFDVTIEQVSDTDLTAVLKGVPVTGFAVEIKAVTYHGLVIEHKDGMWQADIIFDI